MRVFVYWNLHKKTWSIKAMEGPKKGLVVGHSPLVFLAKATPKVSQAGRERVLREKRKNVHAGIVGELVSMSRAPVPEGAMEITYNPYKYRTFVSKETEGEWLGAPLCSMDNRKVYSYV